tara:strand:- start:1091 stop:2443 length:1353 start_codon:yes stop_codon:yes gene_type:complete
MSEFVVENQSEYQIIKAEIRSDRADAGIDIKNVITDITIYEHIEKPYLTAKIVFTDQHNIVQDLDFQGGEKLILKLAHSEETFSGYEISKEFLIDNIENIIKADERSETVMINCTEYHMFESTVLNVNKAYTGSASSIIRKILRDFLDKSVAITSADAVNDMKVIVPNMHPIEACMWLKQRMTSFDGMPYYFFSAMGVDNLILKDLGTILDERIPINADRPYVYAPSVNSDEISMQKYYAIQSFSYRDGENLIRLIEKGLVGAQYSFYDTLTALPQVSHFDIETDILKGLTIDKRLGGQNTRHVYGSDYAVNGTRLTQYNSKVISEISSSGAYTQANIRNNSYNSETLSSSYKKKTISNALREFMSKAPLEISVKSREFLTGDANYSVGKLIRIIFLDNTPERDEQRAVIDHKMSGDYLICAAKHDLNNYRGITKLLCGKLGSFGGEFEL